MLPYQVLSVRPEADGTGIYARFPLERIGTLVGPSGHAQVEAELAVPGAASVRITAVHAQSPKLRRNPAWRASLRLLPAATAGRSELLVGDFNATLDHAEMRRLLGRGLGRRRRPQRRRAHRHLARGRLTVPRGHARPRAREPVPGRPADRGLRGAVLGPPGGVRRAGATARLTGQAGTARRGSPPTLPNAAVTSRS